MTNTAKVVLREPTPDEEIYLEDRINQFNITGTGIPFGGKVSALAYDAHEQLIGGATAFQWGDAFTIEFLWLEQNWRSQNIGTQVMDRLEQEAANRGCTQVYLDTYSFQALAFYKKRGYEVIGWLDNFPTPHQRYFLRKALADTQ
jgi:GNAT superfamily N-acetyltransferase